MLRKFLFPVILVIATLFGGQSAMAQAPAGPPTRMEFEELKAAFLSYKTSNDAQVAEVKCKIGDIEGKITCINCKIDGIEAKIRVMTCEIEGVKRRIAYLEDKPCYCRKDWTCSSSYVRDCDYFVYNGNCCRYNDRNLFTRWSPRVGCWVHY